MALGGMNDKFFSNYLVLNMLGGGQNNLVRGGPLNGMNPLLLGPMFGMEMGLFWMRLRLFEHACSRFLQSFTASINDVILLITVTFRAILIRTLYLFVCLLCDVVLAVTPLILWINYQ